MVYRLVIAPAQIKADTIALDSQQLHYLKVVLRMVDGDRFVAMDGLGKSWLAEIVGNSARILEPVETNNELPIAVTLMAALPKGNSFDLVVRCATELGVDRILPVIGERTLLKPSQNKVERWRKIATEAAEQSERQIVPTIANPLPYREAIATVVDPRSACYICVARGDVPTLDSYLQHRQDKQIILAVGSEGGWTTSEVERAIAVGAKSVSLGDRILRAVTASIVALSLTAAAIERQTK